MLTLLAILLCSAAAVQSEEAVKQPVILPALKDGIESLTDKLTGILYKQALPNENVVVSPINIYGVFSVLLYGADGNTREEIANFLGFPNTNETFLVAHKNFGEFLKSLEIKKVEECIEPSNEKNATTCVYQDVSIANGLFLHKNCKLVPSYDESLKAHYNSSIENNVDFEKEPAVTTDRINKWVAEKTHNLIPKLITQPLESSVRAVLIATLYFSATWQRNIFHSYRTNPDKFNTETGEIQVEYIYNANQVPYYEGESFSAISLPYKGEDFEAIFVLPKINISITDFVEKFSKTQVQRIFNESTVKNVHYRIPCIDVEWSKDLTATLKSLNLTGIFAGVNLSKLISPGTGELKLSKVTHATKLKVDESGTVASAATSIEISLRSGRIDESEPIEFFVTKPFLMIIYHKTSFIPIFTSLIRNPMAK